jgi:AraC-like DNA-binding protein
MKYNLESQKSIGTRRMCFNIFKENSSLLEISDILIHEEIDHFKVDPVIIFVLTGEIALYSDKDVEQVIQKGKLFLLPATTHLQISGLKASSLLFCYLKGNVQFCDCQKLEDLYQAEEKKIRIAKSAPINVLDIKSPLQSCIDSFIEPYRDGLKCMNYLKNKISEILLLLRTYYPAEILAEFFQQVLTRDMAFKAAMQEHSKKRLTAGELAELNHSSVSSFHRHFKKAMGTTPTQWKNEERKKMIYHELKATNKPLKQIYKEYGFSSASYFTKFCWKHLGQSPGKIRKESNYVKNDANKVKISSK